MSEAPDPATLAAIVAAVEAAWPRPGPATAGAGPVETERWRFSARWWSQAAVTRRTRTW